MREACLRHEFELASTRALAAYGSEIQSFLCARLGSRYEGEQAFSAFADALAHALPAFDFHCTVRAYLYTIARATGDGCARAPRAPPASELTESSLQSQIDGFTLGQTDTRERARSLRLQLDANDQTLLILYVDRGLPWSEIALVLHQGPTPLEGDQLARESARLRKRFEHVKAELRALAAKEGLLK